MLGFFRNFFYIYLSFTYDFTELPRIASSISKLKTGKIVLFPYVKSPLFLLTHSLPCNALSH